MQTRIINNETNEIVTEEWVDNIQFYECKMQPDPLYQNYKQDQQVLPKSNYFQNQMMCHPFII